MTLDDGKNVKNYYFGNFGYYCLTFETSNLFSCYKINITKITSELKIKKN